MLAFTGTLLIAAVDPALGSIAWLHARESLRRRDEQAGRGGGESPGVDAELLFRLSRPGDAEVAALLESRARPGEAVLEETGEAYSWSSRIATFSGVPGV